MTHKRSRMHVVTEVHGASVPTPGSEVTEPLTAVLILKCSHGDETAYAMTPGIMAAVVASCKSVAEILGGRYLEVVENGDPAIEEQMDIHRRLRDVAKEGGDRA